MVVSISTRPLLLTLFLHFVRVHVVRVRVSVVRVSVRVVRVSVRVVRVSELEGEMESVRFFFLAKVYDFCAHICLADFLVCIGFVLSFCSLSFPAQLKK